MYFLSEEWMNFVLAVLEQNVLKIKEEKLIKIFELSQVFLHYLFVWKWLNIFTRRLDEILIDGIRTFLVQRNNA